MSPKHLIALECTWPENYTSRDLARKGSGVMAGLVPVVLACESPLQSRQCVRAAKEMDSKSIGLCPQGLESPRCRCHKHTLQGQKAVVPSSGRIQGSGLCCEQGAKTRATKPSAGSEGHGEKLFFYARQTSSAMVPRGLELRTLRLLAVRSDQLSYETSWQCPVCTSLVQEP